ncbi:MAG: ABC transporter substrate-binding protein [Xanthobacteraceae bacterium]|nr:ABC transporter substrate-binding protein [Xanthobacteraceae bacterium]
MKRRLMMTMGCLGALAVAFISPAATPAAAQGKKMVIAAPGIPPIFASVIAYVAERQGFFKKHGANVEVRPFDTGTAAARAVLAGDIEISMSPTPLIINQISNTDANVVAIYGLPNPDWILASTDPTKTNCKDIAGQPVGIDTVGGARSIALRIMLAAGCKEVKLEEVKQVALSSNTAPAMVAGQLTFGVLHLDDVAVLESQGKKVNTLLAMKQTNPTSHYLLLVVRQDKLKENRDAYVRAIAGLIEAARFMQDPKNADKVADDALYTGHPKNISKAALKQFLDISFWAVNDDGMDRKKLEAMIAIQARTGGITAGKEPVKYERLVDQSVWKDAAALVK